MQEREENIHDVHYTGEEMNRTGILATPDRREMEQGARDFEPEGAPDELRRLRMEARAGLPPVGTMPPPASWTGMARDALRQLRGEPTTVLLDKLGERLAFERTGTRLYETILEKHDKEGGFAGGPSREQLLRIRDEEAAHFHLLADKIRELDGDPTTMTPSADLAGVATVGVLKVVNDARTTLAESLEAMLVAELVDRDGWVRLIELAEQAGEEEFARTCRRAEEEEEEHLANVRSWLSAHMAGEAS